MNEQKKFFFNVEVEEALYSHFKLKADKQERSLVKQILWELKKNQALDIEQDKNNATV